MISVRLAAETDFDGWRAAARSLALAGVRPETVSWTVEGRDDAGLFGELADPLPQIPEGAQLNVPRDFVERAEMLICHRDPQRFAFLYRMLLRVIERGDFLRNATDPDVRQFEAMEKSIRRDIHKMRAFVRFRRIEEAGGERYVAWFEPQHFIVERNAQFFVRRFTGMKWTILTPDRSARWDGETLAFGPGATKEGMPDGDAAEDLWKTYFSNIFNPARLKVKAMTAEMPRKYWKNMPETALIPAMIAGADKAHRAMLDKAPTLPPAHHAAVRSRFWSSDPAADAGDADTLEGLRALADGCTRCPLHRDATQTVFGEGAGNAQIVFVGEQPGDQEDIQGRPFVGPAGKVFDAVLEEAGIERGMVYVTNAVKHFKFEPRGKRRIHQKPDAGEVRHCRWWVEKEIALVRPKLLVALGATAAYSLLDRSVAITRERGTVINRESDGAPVLLTYHPSFLLRIRDEEERARQRVNFLQDLVAARQWLLDNADK